MPWHENGLMHTVLHTVSQHVHLSNKVSKKLTSSNPLSYWQFACGLLCFHHLYSFFSSPCSALKQKKAGQNNKILFFLFFFFFFFSSSFCWRCYLHGNFQQHHSTAGDFNFSFQIQTWACVSSTNMGKSLPHLPAAKNIKSCTSSQKRPGNR